MQNSSDTTKYNIYAKIIADGIVERPDVVGAIFGQTEGLIGDELDLRDLQKTGRIGRIEVNIESKGGKSIGEIVIPSSLDRIETVILAASLETIDRVGPCNAKITLDRIEDVRAAKRLQIIARAKELLKAMIEHGSPESQEITEEVKQAVRIEEITQYGPDKLPAGPHIDSSDAIIVVEGRADVLNLLRHGIKNVIAVEGTNIPPSIGELSKTKTVTAFTDGDRGGELILRELMQVAEIDYIARAPEGKGVEELTYKEIVKALRNKLPAEQWEIMRDRKAEGRNHVNSHHGASHHHSAGRKTSRREVIVKRRTLAPTSKKDENVTPTEEEGAKLVISDKTPLTHFNQLLGTRSARLIGKDDEVIKEVSIRELAQALKDAEDIRGVVFDGVITQRIIDIAAAKGVEYLLGGKLGSVIKIPVNLKVLTEETFKMM
ncbi:MAG TPA: DNA primase [Candidatus Syntrophoarchaeum butanivorans]|uniref:DNA primase DnaG n=1 Tax=Candidatus Syntropharchaeum butanivorans TaxID=1839936 RepID=A0A7C1B5S1_9EURY|nr:MAG: DNA primase [Candidatus Syntrophoarchaeum sp. WYZ-LMO15]HDM36518.1 DNA primase [Candidatus Syntrophoarchaeum butanivorans]